MFLARQIVTGAVRVIRCSLALIPKSYLVPGTSAVFLMLRTTHSAPIVCSKII